MMKLLITYLFVYFIIIKISNYLAVQIMFMVMLFIVLGFINFFSMGFYSSIFLMWGVDSISLILIILVVWVSFLILMASLTLLNLGGFNKNFLLYLLSLVIFLFLVFSSMSLFLFYLFFEMSLIPMFMMILGWGVQFDRMEAGFYMFVYTFMFSLPLLICLNYFEFNNFSMFLNISNFLIWGSAYLFIFMNLAFLVKLPVYFLHLWLPKAHVEASIGGSMVLASVMLKLGSYGILRFMILFMNMYNLYSLLLVILSLLGGLVSSLVCLRQMDLKILVAYSSVVHMGVLLGGLILIKNLSLLGSMIIMISHGLCSSGMFVVVNYVYERSGSRSMIINKGLILIFPYLTLIWFLISVNNMSSPPSLSLFGEYFLILSIGVKSFKLLVLSSLILFFSACYSVFFYAYSQYGGESKIFCSIKNIYMREYLLMIMHLVPLNFLFLNLYVFL